MMAKTIIVCENENDSREIATLLRQDQHAVDVVANFPGTAGETDVTSYDLVILDCRNRNYDRVVEDCRAYRTRGVKAPIIVVIPEDDPQREAMMLDAGADDCLLSSFCGPELPARVRALLRRPPEGQPSVIKIQDIELDSSALRVTRAGEEIPLTRKEFEILNLLMKYPNKSFTPESILKRVWDSGSSSTVATVRTHMKTLRRKIGDGGEQKFIKTTRGWGYKVVDGGVESTTTLSETDNVAAANQSNTATAVQTNPYQYSQSQY